MDEFWSGVAVIGLAGWISSALLLIFRSFPAQGRFEKRPAIVWGLALAISYALWVAGLLNA
jgi:hypothetical protein